MDAATANPAISPLGFMLGLMADPKADPNLRFKAAIESAKYVHPRPTDSGDAGEGAKVINAHRSVDDATLVAQADRQSLLQTRAWLEKYGDDPLSAEERAELAALDAKGDLEAALPALKPVVDPVDEQLRSMMADTPGLQDVAQKPVHQDPSEERERIRAKSVPPAEVRSTKPAEEADDGEIVWPRGSAAGR
jgi:hypothetical protein